jgi:hypothetical protein
MWCDGGAVALVKDLLRGGGGRDPEKKELDSFRRKKSLQTMGIMNIAVIVTGNLLGLEPAEPRIRTRTQH